MPTERVKPQTTPEIRDRCQRDPTCELHSLPAALLDTPASPEGILLFGELMEDEFIDHREAACQKAPGAAFYLHVEMTETTALTHNVEYHSRASRGSRKRKKVKKLRDGE